MEKKKITVKKKVEKNKMRSGRPIYTCSTLTELPSRQSKKGNTPDMVTLLSNHPQA